MQVTMPGQFESISEAKKAGKLETSFFQQLQGETDKHMLNRMDKAVKHGHTIITRTKIGRNELCPCNSGKKFKKCCIDKVTPLAE